jgi:DNA-binding transcriptional regulator/RsmH inhibitor MraZ
LLDAGAPIEPQQDVVPVDKRQRITIPSRLAGTADWLAPNNSGLLVSEHFGRIEMRPWPSLGPDVMRERNELRAASKRSAIRVALLEYRYHRYELDAERRMTLHAPALAHLDDRRPVRYVFLLRYDDRLELWTFSAWKKFVADHEDLMPDFR